MGNETIIAIREHPDYLNRAAADYIDMSSAVKKPGACHTRFFENLTYSGHFHRNI
jgi:hypothetical protein